MQHAPRAGSLALLAVVISSAVACSSPPSSTPTTTTSTTTPQPPVPPPPSGNTIGHRPSLAAAACVRTRGSAPLAPDAHPTECHTDAECTAGHNGRCLRMSNHGPHGPSLEATTCSYDACFSDADCDGPRATCICAERAPTEPGTGHGCVTGDCATDADCGAGRYCRRGALGKYCHSPQDQCLEDAPSPCPEGNSCVRDEATNLYKCTERGPILG